MKIISRVFAAWLTLAAFTVLTLTAQAQDIWEPVTEDHEIPHPEWVKRDLVLRHTGSGIKNEFRNKLMNIEILFTRLPDKIGEVAFVCSDGRLVARIAREEGDLYAFIRESLLNTFEVNSNSRRTFRPRMTINSDKLKKTKWIEGPTDRMIMPIDLSIPRKLYNAVVRGDDVALDAGKRFDGPLYLPSINEAFRDFGAACGIGRLAAKD